MELLGIQLWIKTYEPQLYITNETQKQMQTVDISINLVITIDLHILEL